MTANIYKISNIRTLSVLLILFFAFLQTAQLQAYSDGEWIPAQGVSLVPQSQTILLTNGDAFSAGGFNSDENDTLTSIYRHSTNSIDEGPSIDRGRSYPIVTSLDGSRALIAGGGMSDAATAESYIYDDTTGSITPTGSMNQPRSNAAYTTLDDGKILVVGGYNYDFNNSIGHYKLNSVELYDPVTGVWTNKAPFPFQVAEISITKLLDGRVMVNAGYGGDGEGSRVFIYDPDDDTWSETGRMVISQYFPGYNGLSTLPNGKVLAVAGINTQTGPLQSTEIWDPSTSQWELASSIPATNRSQIIASSLMSDFGTLVTTIVDDQYVAFVRDFDSGEWVQIEPFPVGENWNTVNLHDGNLLVVGGSGGGEGPNVFVYSRPTFSDESPPQVIGTPDRPANSFGWYSAGVTVSWASNDPEPSSGSPSVPLPVLADIEGTNTYTSDQSCDPAKNCATGSIQLSIDKTLPTSSFSSGSSLILRFLGRTISGTAGDNVSGVQSVVLSFGSTNLSSEDGGILLNCTEGNCRWSANRNRLPVGLRNYTLNVVDFAGNTTSINRFFIVI